jgi:hypothetical protein
MTHEPTPEQLAAWTEYILALNARAVKESAATQTGVSGTTHGTRDGTSPAVSPSAPAADQTEATANRYADFHIRRDKLHRDDGRPDDDRDTGGRPI